MIATALAFDGFNIFPSPPALPCIITIIPIRVSRLSVRLSLQDLWRKETAVSGLVCDRTTADVAGHTEIYDLDIASRSKQNIRRVEVAVCDVPVMTVLDCINEHFAQILHVLFAVTFLLSTKTEKKR